ncbi:MAG: tRNA (adenosine(37)-N6)-threonylcarbamoyltransferase complex ATPase subunit type 1 TsaE [Lachnospiraceae bacterium]|nr:tRNA (adenosine(37)-N6)-threonylcarbamoyltransferase complex ATPase subunit type 1 TsaE [Lachnospiraceae bacterium]
MLFESNSAKETFDFGLELGKKAVPGQVICLDGDLGTGKTVLTKGIAAGLGITEPVVSPTFTIVQIYEQGRIPLYHFDVYRIDDPDEMEEIGYREYFYGNGLTIVEWSGLIEDILPRDAMRIRLSKDASKGFDYRRIECL